MTAEAAKTPAVGEENANSGQALGLAVDFLLALYVGGWGAAFVLIGLLAARIASFDRSEIVIDQVGVQATPTLPVTVYRMLLWGGVATFLSGGLMIVVALWFAARNSRARSEDPSIPLVRRDRPTTVLLGAAVTTAASSVAFSPVVGGALSGYFGTDVDADSLLLGVLSGVVIAFPLVLPTIAVVAALVAGGFVLLAATITVALVSVLAYAVVLGAVGSIGGHTIAVRYDLPNVLKN